MRIAFWRRADPDVADPSVIETTAPPAPLFQRRGRLTILVENLDWWGFNGQKFLRGETIVEEPDSNLVNAALAATKAKVGVTAHWDCGEERRREAEE
jgi:hypothetical protein